MHVTTYEHSGACAHLASVFASCLPLTTRFVPDVFVLFFSSGVEAQEAAEGQQPRDRQRWAGDKTLLKSLESWDEGPCDSDTYETLFLALAANNIATTNYLQGNRSARMDAMEWREVSLLFE